mmetsp:Transcript_41066/g.103473  ORF Transcript_41066/g.103473 Transcript_41066/m.103473 type:complete len:1621 (+) Transcript_41066:244-5106(+)
MSSSNNSTTTVVSGSGGNSTQSSGNAEYRVVVVKTSSANTGSMVATLRRCGATTVTITDDPAIVAAAQLVVVPGVSSFGSTMDYLRKKNLVETLRERIARDDPTFLVCVGLQILSENSEESPGCKGLGVISAVPCVRFPPAVRVPQQAWNVVTADNGCKFLKTGNAYFSNSYCLRSIPLGWRAATSEHGVLFVSALERGKVLATQFHPELSGSYGLALMKSWIISSLGLHVPPTPSPFYANAEAVKRQRISVGREMLHRVIPCLDVRDGRVVKGVKFSGLQDAGDPVQLALEYERQGADEIVMLDITATNEKRQAAMETVSALSACLSIPLTVGGGVRSLEDAKTLLQAGADKVAINTAAVRHPELLKELSTYCGSNCVVIAIDAVQIWSEPPEWEVVISAGKEKTGIDVVEWARTAVQMGAGEILLTSFDRDGTKSGYDLKLLQAVSSAVNVPVIASGGASSAEHMVDALKAGADAVLAASIFHYGEMSVEELKRILGKSVPVRIPVSYEDARDPWSPKREHQTTQCVIPSIDLINGHAVQLVGGDPEKLKIDAGDPIPIAHRFRLAGEIAVIDLDAALSRGSNETVIRKLLSEAPCRVGGGIRSVERARQYLDWGAQRVIIGTAAKPELLKQLPRDRVIVALDARHGEVVVDGWQTKTGRGVAELIEELKPYAGGFLVTFVEREGLMQGIDLSAVRRLAKLCNEGELTSRLCVAGGITTVEEVRALDQLGVEGQVGMALYSGRLTLADALLAPVTSERADGLMPTVVVDQQERCLGLVYSSPESVAASVESLRGVYWSRKRGLWQKGLTSGNYQELLAIRTDCDRDALQFVVRQQGVGFCHLETYSCFGQRRGIAGLMHTLEERRLSAPVGSYTKRLYEDPVFLKSKLIEEAHELGDAATKAEVAAEAADVLYFALVACARTGVSITDIERVFDQRALKVSRRPGNAKPQHDQSKLQPATNVAAAVHAAQPPPPNKQAEPCAAAPCSSAPAAVNTNEAKVDAEQEEDSTPLLRRLRPQEVPRGRRMAFDERSAAIAQKIVKEVQSGGLDALVETAVRLGDLASPQDKLFYSPQELEKAFRALDRDTRQLLRRTADRIKAFAESQRNSLQSMRTSVPGGRAGHLVTPVPVAGCYAPGGRYPLPSSVLMTALTARVAGCASVWVASPRPQPVTLAAAHVAGADGLLAVGGAQAIAALAYGIRDPDSPDRYLLPACDAVVGPGNRFVTAAKQLVAGTVQIEGLAGPSELLVVADESADPAVVAADLIAQAEHDPCAVPILISLSAELVDRVDAQLRAQLRVLPTADTARLALANNSAAVVVSTIRDAADLADLYAPEHLEVQTRDAHEDAKLFQHFGALFIGAGAAEVFGDYGAGPNHTLPTGGTARSTGGLSVLTFLRVRTFIEIEDVATPAAQLLTRDAAALAMLEGLHGHAASANRRLRDVDSLQQDELTSSGSNSDLLALPGTTPCSPAAVPSAGIAASAGSPRERADGTNLVLTDPCSLPPPSLSDPALLSASMRLAIAKGRMFDNVAALLREAGVNMSVGGRNLRPTIDMPNWDIKLLKPRNVVEMLQLGTRDVGFAGTDLLEELSATNVVPYFNTKLDPVCVCCTVGLLFCFSV